VGARKDHHTLIGAFLRAFKPTNNVELVLKTRDYGTWKHYPKSAGESISELLWTKPFATLDGMPKMHKVRSGSWTRPFPGTSLPRSTTESDV